ncbi:MAG: alanine/glycine:cation symporter family protein [Lachnospiraceae bacterium]|nr:alanine/glycine:cation symporter family protein [Lachnospiraceae bacterium]
MKALETLLSNLAGKVWGIPMLVLLVGTHLFLTIRLHFIQRHTGKGIRLSIAKDQDGEGDISQFGALATALAATIGTGNIIGVSTAVALGGPGAIFWTWITGVFGMATKYAESLLAVRYRVKKTDGSMVGGPMYVLENGLHMKWLAVIFAVFTVFATFGTGCAVQSNAITAAIGDIFPVYKVTLFGGEFNLVILIAGALVTLITALVIIGGIKKISKVCERLVPFMAVFYIAGCLALLIYNGKYVGPAIVLILKSAFEPQAAVGGLVGSGMIAACRYGVARGLFSNEAGLGTAPIAAAAAQTKNPVRQALVSMTGTFWDTVIVCLMTGLVIISSVLSDPAHFVGLENDQYVRVAFAQLPVAGKYILTIALAVFAFTTILGWSFYGETCLSYLFGKKSIIVYRIVFLAVLFIGSVVSLGIIWNFSDLFNGLMAFPNLICLLLLSGVVVKETRHYLWEDRLDENGN